jgi:hypothetical protein
MEILDELCNQSCETVQQREENKIKSFNENSKMFLYKKLKLNVEREFYLSYNNSDIRRGFYCL